MSSRLRWQSLIIGEFQVRQKLAIWISLHRLKYAIGAFLEKCSDEDKMFDFQWYQLGD